jgi:5-methyltetrahydrofolate--homocysteine methyltransferase
MSDYAANFEEISTLLQKGKAKDIVVAVQKALDAGASPQDILEKGLISGMNIIGGKFKRNEVFVPEVLVAARAMNHASAVLKPALTEAGVEPVGKAIICTVKGDLHDIGKNLVKMMIEGKGIEVSDLGVDCKEDKIIEAVRDSGAKVLCLSALLTTTMMAIKDVIEALKASGLREKVKVMIGGAPVTQSFADEVGADAYTPDAATAAEVCRTFYAA